MKNDNKLVNVTGFQDERPGLSMPVHGKSNTEFHNDWGTPGTPVHQNAREQRGFMGVQPKPKEFQPFFRFGGATNGGTSKAMSDGKVGGTNIGQPSTLAYRMQSQGVKLGK